jgi:hypothetical protein
MKYRSFKFSYDAEPGLAAPFDAKVTDSGLFEVRRAAPQTAPRLRLERQVPAMYPRDEVVFLVHTAAEIEHSLLAQYLFAAYSLPKTNPHRRWRSMLIQIAREEMGHLLSAQNMLLALGGPMNFEREDFPYNAFYPYPFELRPVSVQSLARYVLAEMPDDGVIPPELNFDHPMVRQDAGVTSPGTDVNRVGALFELLLKLAGALSPTDVLPLSQAYQANPIDWNAPPFSLVLTKLASLADLAQLIGNIGAQGEGPTEPVAQPSHFVRFYQIYQEAKQYLAADPSHSLGRPIASNPTVQDAKAEGYLSDPTANAWGDVFNHRYRWLLTSVAHALVLDDGPDRTQLRIWAFEEMTTVLPRVAELVSSLPQHAGTPADGLFAGAPFELPYTLALPSRDFDRWRHQMMLLEHSGAQIDAIGDGPLSRIIKTVDAARLPFLQQKLQPMA